MGASRLDGDRLSVRAAATRLTIASDDRMGIVAIVASDDRMGIVASDDRMGIVASAGARPTIGWGSSHGAPTIAHDDRMGIG
jgi:hypothetical protein